MAISSGNISTVAGQGTTYPLGDGGPATSASLFSPYGVALDSSGNLYIADTGDNCIRKVNATTHIITTVAGNSNISRGYSGDGGAATSAQLDNPYGVALDSSGNIYIADSNNNCIRKVSASTGKIDHRRRRRRVGIYSGDGGAATLAKLSIPEGLALDSSGNVYIADTYSSRIRKVYQ